MRMKLIIVLAFVVIVGSLVSAGVLMLRSGRDDDPAKRSRMVRALTVRVAASVAVFLFILFSWRMGWIEPTGVPIGR
jgi:uncharacterized membrane protein